MPPDPDVQLSAPVQSSHGGILAVVLVYAVSAALWILLSDKAVQLLFNDPAQITLAGMIKGWLFVGITSLLLYGLLRRLAGADKAKPETGFEDRTAFFALPRWTIYVIALAASMAMLLVRESLGLSFGQHPLLILFMFPIVISAILGGFGPGLLATMVSAVVTILFVVPSGHSLPASYDIFQWSLLIANGLLVSVLAEVLHRSRRQAEIALAERSQALRLLQAIADGSDDAIFAKDREGRYLLFNRAAVRAAGKPLEAVLGRDDHAIFPPGQADMLMAIGQRVMDEDQLECNEEALTTSSGERVFLGTKGPLHDSDGRVVGIFGISRDITGQKQAEAALRQERDLKQHYLDTAQTLMLALDAEGGITMINRTGCALLGYAENELLGRHWFEIALPQPDGMERVYPVFRSIMAGNLQAAEYFENEVLCRDGRTRLIAWHNAYLTDDAGRIIGTLSSGEDITARKTTEAALRQQTGELLARNEELERFNRAVVGRELDMVALKQQVNALSSQLGLAPPYPLGFLEAPAGQPDAAPAR
ncbi:MAG: PAS domain S-box protein [Thiobacillus sp.]|nr:PAS domain S-box protein [Thiobacillus sp.]